MEAGIKLDELAEQSGFPARTIRLYIAQELLPPPRRAGPKSSYGSEHLERLTRIRELQNEGLTLSEIRRRLDGVAAPSIPPPETVQRFHLAPEVVVELRGTIPPWRARQIAKALEQFAAAISQEQGEKE